ncbi:DNA polymerase epsilon subunit B [Rutidosis leptorrhynchoides]|uniref:DNA polymerase epsilon subunit B n=1 Tax=Rutidosis leptorrhynchoides TaxID=125765 RepID=UPI003A99095C
MSGTMKSKIKKQCKMRGYILKLEALNEILNYLNNFLDPVTQQDEALNILLDELHNRSLKSSILDKEIVQRVASQLIGARAANEVDVFSTNTSTALSVIDAFVIPKFRYDPIRKIFCQHTGRLPIHGDAPSKAWLYRDRFLLLSQRLTRIPQFSKPSFSTESSEFGSCEISQIQSLVGRTGISWVMGVISQLEDGHFYLEDLTAAVEINLSNAKVTTGYFSENTIVLAQGEMLLDGTFQVQTFGFPPLEDRDKSTSLFTGLDYFGSGTITKDESKQLAEMESMAVNEMFVVLSDIWLDDEKTMEKLETVLDTYENEVIVPSLFVLMGNFCSRPFNLSSSSFSSIRSNFAKLGQMIGNHQRLTENSRFIFIPGPEDAGPSTVLPRCALPKYITEELKKYIPNAIFASNPCRIKWYTQEITFFRQDLLHRMRRSCLIPPSTEETKEPFEHLVATIIHQSHLCPLPLSVQPIIWNYDHCLHLYPTPHTIVLADRSNMNVFNYSGTTCLNPGSFSLDTQFAVFRPLTRIVELSDLNKKTPEETSSPERFQLSD